MALRILQPGVQPLGQFDGLDSEIFTLKGGEVVTFGTTALTSGDKAAADVFDGYQNPTLNAGTRTVIKLATVDNTRPLMLADEGTTGYGTMFGQLVGGQIGVNVAGTVFGPHSAAGSGKVTCWDKPGLYAVSLDAVDSTALNPKTAGAPALAAGGVALHTNASGLLTTAGGSGARAGNRVGSFVEFSSGGSLVNTAAGMAVALSGTPGAYQNRNFRFMVFHFSPVTA